MPRYKYTLLDDEVIQTEIKGVVVTHPYFNLSRDGILTISRNYSWDGMTCYPDDATTYLASLYHDCLYQMIELNILSYKYKRVADKLLYSALIRDGHPKLRAMVVYIAVSVFGGYFIQSNNNKK